MTGAFEIHKANNGQYFFHLKAENGEIILASEQYQTKAGAQGGMDSVEANASNDQRFERKTSESNQPYFVLKAANGETIGRSQMYSSEAAMEKGIESVKAHAASATVKDLS